MIELIFNGLILVLFITGMISCSEFFISHYFYEQCLVTWEQWDLLMILYNYYSK